MWYRTKCAHLYMLCERCHCSQLWGAPPFIFVVLRAKRNVVLFMDANAHEGSEVSANTGANGLAAQQTVMVFLDPHTRCWFL